MSYEHGGIFAAQDDSAPEGQALATLANIKDFTDGRDRAIELWLESYDHFHTHAALAAAASVGGNISLAIGSDRNNDISLSAAFMATGTSKYWDQGRQLDRDAREHFTALVTATVDRGCWTHLMSHLGFDVLLDRQAREEFRDSIKDTPPPFTVENCQATFGSVWLSRRDMYLRGIANTFMAMDRRFRSHDAFAIGNRLVIDRAFGIDSSWWVSDNRRDTLHDVERIFRELDGKGPIPMSYGISHRRGEPVPPEEVEGIVGKVVQARQDRVFPMLVRNEYFRVRVFQNGNLHLWFERKDLLKQVNELLLEYYKPVEGDVGQGPTYERGPAYHATPAKNFGEFFSSDAVAAAVMDRAEIAAGHRVLEPSAGAGTLAKAARAAGASVQCVEIQPGLAHELRVLHGFRDTIEADFLQLDPARVGLFDRIVMNPPFDRGRDCDHVRHAFQFLKPGGVLVAVMSARAEHCTDARHKPLHDLIDQCGDRPRWAWRDLPEKSFAHAGTNVNTVTLYLRRPR